MEVKERMARKADNLTAISKPIVYLMWDLRRSQPYGPPQPEESEVVATCF
jgi:hypothetical protein